MVRRTRVCSRRRNTVSPSRDQRCATHNGAAGSDRAGAGLSAPPMLIAFNKPFGVACKFRPEPGRKTLADYIEVRSVYPAGRLDTDSEGLMLLTDDGVLQARIAEPKHNIEKVYWAQVEGSPSLPALDQLRKGVSLGDFTTQPAQANLIEEPQELWPREPPIRYRAKIPTAWIALTIREGKNRQV